MDYDRNDKKGWGGDPSRGAAMGRVTTLDAPPDYSGEVTLIEVHVDLEGYDRKGTYFGSLAAREGLYWYQNTEGTIDAVFRADGLDDARADVLKQYPNVKFRTASAEGMLEDFISAFSSESIDYGQDRRGDRCGELADKFSTADIAPEAMVTIREECAKFLATAAPLLNGRAASAGKSFYHDRCGDGTGFYDEDWGSNETVLSDLAKTFGPFELYPDGPEGEEKLYSETM